MIEFYGDNLVPPELCCLLCQAVPKKHHVPVRFFNRHDALGKPTGRGDRNRSTLIGVFAHEKRPWIGINLNSLYTRSIRGHRNLAPSTAVWLTLVEVCLHEFGHAATKRIAERMNCHEYHAEPQGRVYRCTEQLADDWKDRRVARILKQATRLGQPQRLTGYLGARLAEATTRLRQAIQEPRKDVRISGSVRAAYVKEQRCWRTGAQLTSGDVLREIGLEPHRFTNAYPVLRRTSDGVGIDYIDGFGRRHKLYAWGDVPVLRKRMEERLRELVLRRDSLSLASQGGEDYTVSGDGQVGPSREAAEWGDPDVPF